MTWALAAAALVGLLLLWHRAWPWFRLIDRPGCSGCGRYVVDVITWADPAWAAKAWPHDPLALRYESWCVGCFWDDREVQAGGPGYDQGCTFHDVHWYPGLTAQELDEAAAFLYPHRRPVPPWLTSR